MTKKKPTEKLTGEDAFLAATRAIAKRNDEARARLEKERAPHEARVQAWRREAELKERATVPAPGARSQPEG